jgi:hypothetical protein
MAYTQDRTRWSDPGIEEAFLRLAGGAARDPDDLVRLWAEHTGKPASRSQIDAAMKRFKLTAHDIIRAHALKGQPDLTKQVRDLKSRVRVLEDSALTDERIEREILGLREGSSEPPGWLLETQRAKKGPGVPTLFATDWHWGERVEPSEIGGVNRYNVEIAHERARAFFTSAIDLLTNHMVCPEYPGIVLDLGGDMLSGDIHEELSQTNELESIPALLDLRGVLRWGISELRKRWPVFVVGVTGNHPRQSPKPRAKRRNHTNFDWLLYKLLEGDFADDKEVAFQIPDGPDALYQVYGHRYLLTHGDQFRGGDGMIGALGPIIRGDHKKRSRNGQIDQGYDTLVLGHWHQLIQMQRLIVGGSLKGYDEYANAGNFPYEPPRQALWVTHPDHGITLSMPVLVEKQKRTRAAASWVSWAA